MAQNQPGLAIIPSAEAGGSHYLANPILQVQPTDLDVNVGTELEFRTSERWALRLGPLLAYRRYKEKKEFSGYELDHRAVNLGWRLTLAKALMRSTMHNLDLLVGISARSPGRTRVAVAAPDGREGVFDTPEAGSGGLRIGAEYSRPGWLHGALRVGFTADLQLVGTQADFYLPWAGRYSLGVGHDRLFVGAFIGVRLLALRWKTIVQE